MTLPPHAVLFDCDGVIVDSERPTFLMLQQDFAAHGLSLTLEELERDWVGFTVEILADRARTLGATLPAGWVADFYRRLYLRLATEAPLVPGIVAVFDALDRAGLRYAVGSNGTPEKMQVTLGGHGLLPRFGAVLSGQALGRPKPAPDLWLAAAAALGVAPSACVVVEDSAAGARAARVAGIRCFGYAPHGHDPRLAAEGAVQFHSMSDLPRLLGLPGA